MYVWVAVMMVCYGPLAIECKPMVFGKTFEEIIDCQTEIQGSISAAYQKGLVAYGSCSRVKLSATLIYSHKTI